GHGPLSTSLELVFSEAEEIERDIETIANAGVLVVMAAEQSKFRRSRDFRKSLQQFREPFWEALVILKRETRRRICKQQVHIRAEFPWLAENLFLRVNFISGPGVAFRALDNGDLRIHSQQELAQLPDPNRFFDVIQHLRFTFQVVVAKTAVRRSPRQLERLIVAAEFNGIVGLHRAWRGTSKRPMDSRRPPVLGWSASIWRAQAAEPVVGQECRNSPWAPRAIPRRL